MARVLSCDNEMKNDIRLTTAVEFLSRHTRRNARSGAMDSKHPIHSHPRFVSERYIRNKQYYYSHPRCSPPGWGRPSPRCRCSSQCLRATNDHVMEQQLLMPITSVIASGGLTSTTKKAPITHPSTRRRWGRKGWRWEGSTGCPARPQRWCPQSRSRWRASTSSPWLQGGHINRSKTNTGIRTEQAF